MKIQRLPANNELFITNRQVLQLIKLRIIAIFFYYRKQQKIHKSVITSYTSFAREHIKKLHKAYKLLK